MYWAPGAVHGPHQVFKEWSDKYKGKFDEGWDKLREEIFTRQKQLGSIPADAELIARAPTMPSWDSIPESERAFQLRLMEIYAGFCEHTDAQVGKLVDYLEQTGQRDNTIIFYVWGDNGSSAEGQNGSISELLAQNQIPNTIAQQTESARRTRRPESPRHFADRQHVSRRLCLAGDTPLRYTKLIASHFGGTRNPLVVSWPKKIKPDKAPRSQFYHVNDVAPTLYDVIGIKPPKVVNGFAQDPIDGVSMAASFTNPKAPENKHIQYFDNNGSDGIYQDGWYACTFGPLIPWLNAQPGLADWDSSKDVWELYDLTNDFSQMHDLAKKRPDKLAEMKKLFLAQAKENKVFPIGAGIWLRIHPEDRIKDALTRVGPSTTPPHACRSSPRPRWVTQVTPLRLTSSAARMLAACFTLSAARVAASPVTWTRGNLFSNTT